jgi:hypothetical protein
MLLQISKYNNVALVVPLKIMYAPKANTPIMTNVLMMLYDGKRTGLFIVPFNFKNAITLPEKDTLPIINPSTIAIKAPVYSCIMMKLHEIQ